MVNNAGIGLTKLFLNTTLAEWERVLRTDLTGVFCVPKRQRVMVQQGGGRIIQCASLSGQRGGTGQLCLWSGQSEGANRFDESPLR